MKANEILQKNPQEEIAIILRKNRREHGFTLKETRESLAKKMLKVPSIPFLSKVETPGSKTKPTNELFEALLAVYKISPKEFEKQMIDYLEAELQIEPEEKNWLLDSLLLLKSKTVGDSQKARQGQTWIKKQLQSPATKEGMTYANVCTSTPSYFGNDYPKDPKNMQKDIAFNKIKNAFEKLDASHQNLLVQIAENMADMT